MDESCEPIIPYGFFGEHFLDLNDSSLIIQYDPRVVIERPEADEESYTSLICKPTVEPRPKKVFRPLDYVQVSLKLEFFCKFQLKISF